MTSKQTTLLLLCLCCASILPLMGQKNTVAQAIPAQSIVADESLKDWPEGLLWYTIDSYYGPDKTHDEDFSARFTTAHHLFKNELYVAVQVTDDSHISSEVSGHQNQDHMLLYLNFNYNKRGAAPLFVVGAKDVLEVHTKSAQEDPFHQSLDTSDFELAIARKGNTTIYEWIIQCPEKIRLGTHIGIDHFIIDQDEGQENQANVLWRDGFWKSAGGQKLGTIVLTNTESTCTTVTGVILVEDNTVDNKPTQFRFQSTINSDIFYYFSTDSTGRYAAHIPAGTYQLTLDQSHNIPQYYSSTPDTAFRIVMDYPTVTISGATQRLDTLRYRYEAEPYVRSEQGLLFQPLSDDVMAVKMDAFLDSWQSYLSIPAVSAAVIKNNQVIYQTMRGVDDVSTGASVMDSSLFEAASITKPVFALIALRLEEKGIIDLDEPLYKTVPFEAIAHDDRYKLITGRMVLNHQTGFPNWAIGGPGNYEGRFELLFTPGEDFGYSGEGFNYLGRVLEKRSGKTLPELFDEEIRKPAGLHNTYFHFTDELHHRKVRGHYQLYPTYKGHEYYPSPASSLLTNAEDFSKLMLLLIDEGHFNPSIYAKIYSDQTILSEEHAFYDKHLEQTINYGFFTVKTPDGTYYMHGGNNGDYHCKFAYNPTQNIGYCVFTNSNLGEKLHRKVEEYLIYDRYKEN